MEGRPSEEISAAEAVLVGALSSGVNVRTFLLMAQNYCNEFHVQCLPSQFNSNSVSFHCGIVFVVVRCSLYYHISCLSLFTWFGIAQIDKKDQQMLSCCAGSHVVCAEDHIFAPGLLFYCNARTSILVEKLRDCWACFSARNYWHGAICAA